MPVSHRTLMVSLAGLLLLSHGVLLSQWPLLWRTLAALCIGGLLPGLLLVAWLCDPPEDGLGVAEQGLYAIGAGYMLLVCGTLFASYWPGRLSQGLLLALFDALTVLFGGLWWRKIWVQRISPFSRMPLFSKGRKLDRAAWLAAAWLTLLLVGGFFRVTDLGYSEFQSDEASPALRAAAVVQGSETVLFLHKKGPTEILIPTALFALTGQLTEQSGRLPFALANLACLLTVFVLGWRLFNPLAGWLAALLLALDGYYIGYAHMLQYQSILFLMTPLAVLVLYRLAYPAPLLPAPSSQGEMTERFPSPIMPSLWAGLGRALLLAALFVTTGLLSHYDAVLVFLPGLYLLWVLVRRGVSLAQLGRALLIPVCVSGLLLASFYLPFVLHPHFGETYTYYTTHVIGTGRWLYNHLVEFADRATLFNTVYAFGLVVGVTIIALAHLYWCNLTPWIGRLLAALVVGSGLLAIVMPNGLVILGFDLMPVLFGLFLLGAVLMPKLSDQARLLWLWFGLPLLQALFLTKEPSAHFHVFLVPWFLLVGQTLAWGWQQWRRFAGERMAMSTGLGLVALCVLLFGSYEAWFYLDRVEAARNWQEIGHPLWWPVHASMDGQPLFGVPHDSGWKTIGVLYQEGKLRGSYDTNIRSWESDWYTRGAEYCEDNARYVFLERSRRRDKQADFYANKQNRYQLFGTVDIAGEPHLEIYQRDAVTMTQHFDAAVYAPRFDQMLSGPDFHLGPPTVDPVLTPVHYRLGEQLELVGYRLEQTQVRAGSTLLLTLQWRANSRVPVNYTLFTQLVGPQDKMMGQLDTAPSCLAGPTRKWKPGTLVSGFYQIPIFAQATPGIYPLRIGLYQPDSGARLPVSNAQGNVGNDQIQLAQITITP